MNLDDISFDTRAFPRGRLGIYTDADAPCARQLVVVRRRVSPQTSTQAADDIDDNAKPQPVPMPHTYEIEYIRPTRTMGRLGPCHGDMLTPVEHFGLRPEFITATGILRLVQSGECTATYRDGKPRRWQGETVTSVHPKVLGLINDLYGQ